MGDIVQRVRANGDYERIAETVKRTELLPDYFKTNSLVRILSCHLGRLARDVVGEIKHFGHASGLGLIPESEVPPLYYRATSAAWTSVLDDQIFLDHLIPLYFKWVHPFYKFFPQSLFLHETSRGKSK